MGKNEIHDLEDILFKYERLAGMIGVIQMLVAEVAEIAGTSKDDLSNSLLEVELEMGKNNKRLENAIQQKGGAA